MKHVQIIDKIDLKFTRFMKIQNQNKGSWKLFMHITNILDLKIFQCEM